MPIAGSPGMGTLRFWTCVCLLAAVTAGCSTVERAPSRAQLQVVDDAGDTIRLPHRATRVVSLIPSTTELLFAVGAGNAVVGRTSWCKYPPAALSVPAVGDGMTPNLEAVAARRPDLVVLYQSSQNALAARQLHDLGIATMQVRTDALADVGRVGTLLGRLTGHEAEADAMARAFADSLAAATVSPSNRAVSVFILVWQDPPITIGAGSYLTELVERAGGRNIYRDLPAPSGQISIESAVARDPDVVLVLGDSMPAFAGRPEWQTVPAVRERRFVHASGTMFGQPSPRAPAAIRYLARQLRAFRDRDSAP